MDFLFRHEAPRKFQKEMLEDIYSAIAQGSIFLANAPTGSGKTDAAISAALTYAADTNLTTFFLTPKISQHKIALDVVAGIGKKYELDVRAVDLVGKRHMCLLETSEYDNESFYHFCDNKRKRKACEFYNRARALDFASEKKLEEILQKYGHGMSFMDAINFSASYGFCPYELLLRIAAFSNVIICDYYHFLVPKIRNGLFAKLNKQIEDSIVIVDEAHNLAKRARSYLSMTITEGLVRKAEKELKMFGFDAEKISEKFDDWASEILGKKDEVVIEKEELYPVLSSFSSDFLINLEDAGTAYINSKNKKSAALKLALFLAEWENEHEAVRIVKRTATGYKIAKKIIDPSILTSSLNQAYAVVLMSGTLLPFEMHIDVLGLDRNRIIAKSYPSPFPQSNIINIISTTATTRYTERTIETYKKIAREINEIIKATPGGCAVFFPSYVVMESILPMLDCKKLHIQKSEMEPREVRDLLVKFSEEGGVLCGVQGGSLAEGVDFCNSEIKTIVIVGIGLEEMNAETEALIEYYEKKFKKGWEYAYLYPGTIKALQAAGRARRKESDRVAVVYLDERFRWKNYKWIFNGQRVIVSNTPAKMVEEFWKKEASVYEDSNCRGYGKRSFG